MSDPAVVGMISTWNGLSLEDDEALTRCFASDRLSEHESRQLHRLTLGGERTEPSDSEADYHLAILLVKGGIRDDAQVDRIMRASEIARTGQGREAKWDRNRTYLARTITSALRASPPPLEPTQAAGTTEHGILHYTDLQILALPDPEWLIDGLLLKGGMTLLVGRYGAGKSFLAIDWAMHIAGGMTWQGRTTRRGMVLYVFGEGSLKSRVAAWRAAHGVAAKETVGVVFAPGTVNLLDDESVTRLLTFIGDVKPAAIVFDTLSRMTPGGDENDSETAGRLVAATGRIQRKTGAAVLLAHHTPWAADQQRPRGHSKVADAADAIFLLENTDGALKLICQKQREGEAPAPIHLKLTPQDGALVVDGGTPPLGDSDRVVSAIGDHERVTAEELSRRLNVSRRPVNRWLEAAEREKKVVATGSGLKGDPKCWARWHHLESGGANQKVPNGGQGGTPSIAKVPSNGGSDHVQHASSLEKERDLPF